MFLLSFYFGYKMIKNISLQEKHDVKSLDSLLYYLMTGTIIGARLGHCLFYDPSFYLNNPLKILAFWEGGLASHGGALGIILSTIIYCRKYNESFFWLISRLTIPIALAGFFIRLGNLFNSEIVGNETSVPWGVIFIKRTDLIQIPRHPAQIYESIAYICVFWILLLIFKRVKEKRANFLLLGCFLVSVFTARFFIEFLKVKQESYDAGPVLNTGQLLSIPFILIGMTLLSISFKSTQQRLKEIPL